MENFIRHSVLKNRTIEEINLAINADTTKPLLLETIEGLENQLGFSIYYQTHRNTLSLTAKGKILFGILSTKKEEPKKAVQRES